MLKQRILTALLLIPCVIFVLYSGINWLFASLTLVLLAAMSFEYTQLISFKALTYKIIFVVLLGLCVIPIVMFRPQWIFVLDLLIWLGIFIALWSDPTTKCWWSYSWLVCAISVIVLPTFASSLLIFYKLPHGTNYILYVLCVVWATDIGAYFSGKLFGKHKLIPWISPGKTIEGTIGGFVCALGVIAVGCWLAQPKCILWWFMSGVGTVFMAIIGDLFISMLKRRCNLKDTGTILPGHGGILDRLDSLLSALPFFLWSYSFCFAVFRI